MEEKKDQITEEARFQLRKGLGMYLGINVEPPTEDNIVNVSQTRLIDGVFLNQKHLAERGRAVYPEKQYKIHPHVHWVDLDSVTPEWIEEQMREYGLKRKDLMRQLALDPSSISQYLSGKRGMTKPVRAMFYYYFNTYRLSKAMRSRE